MRGEGRPPPSPWFWTKFRRRLCWPTCYRLEHQHRQCEGRGVTGEEAQREARLKFGGLEQVKDECRQAHGVSLIETSIQDVRHALRAWRRSPSFAAVG